MRPGKHAASLDERANGMSRSHVSHREVLRFAEEKVNLPKEKADEYRAQAGRVRERLEGYIADHPDFTLKKIQLSGSLAKGTALRSLNDIDMAVYVSGSDAPHDLKQLLEYLAERLRKMYPNFSPDQVKPQTYSVTVSFRGSGLDVDVVPVLYAGLPDWRGDLISQDDGSFLETSIPLHLEFARKRKRAQPNHFAQVVRLVKFWTRLMKKEREDFRFKSFMIEMILAKLCDQGVDFSDYPEAMQAFFTYVARTGLRERIVFEDHYLASSVPSFADPVQIIDPINASNNVARLYTAKNAEDIVEAALDAGDAIDSALAAPTKELTVRYWQKVLGTTFQG
jgi:tRNA nucleotidyltransferase (CCA-adding enzyme)